MAFVLVAACAGLATAALALGPYPHEPKFRVILALLACAPAVLLRRSPVPVFAFSVAAASIVVASGNALLPLGLVTGVATYFVASRLPRHLSMRMGAAAVASLGVALAYAALTRTKAPLSVVAVEGIVPVVAAWFIGDSVAARMRYVAGLVEQAKRERAAEAERAQRDVREERVRIARELHDVVAHTLAVITVQAGVGRRLMEKRPEEASTALESIETIGRSAQDELRVVLALLREEDGPGAELVPAPCLVDLKELVENVHASGTPVELRLARTRPLSGALELSVFRVVQEALTNVVKHAPGAPATVELDISAREIHLEITDEGCPSGVGVVDPLRSDGPVAGHGIVGMRERVAAFGGWLVAEPLAPGGFRVSACIPIEDGV
jgi:signal transduction histidine kinase